MIPERTLQSQKNNLYSDRRLINSRQLTDPQTIWSSGKIRGQLFSMTDSVVSRVTRDRSRLNLSVNFSRTDSTVVQHEKKRVASIGGHVSTVQSKSSFRVIYISCTMRNSVDPDSTTRTDSDFSLCESVSTQALKSNSNSVPRVNRSHSREILRSRLPRHKHWWTPWSVVVFQHIVNTRY